MSDPTIDEHGDETIGHPHLNSSDATVGQPLVLRVQQRKAELEALQWNLAEDDLQTRSAIDLALATIAPLLTGDLEHIPAVVNADLSRWLERNKHVAETNVSFEEDADAPSSEPVSTDATVAA